jgi:hypothetical protein
MKTIVRYLSAAAVWGVALVFSGCTTQTARAPRVEPVAEFTVVESSTEKELTPEQLVELRQAVINYLHSQGLKSNQLYYVKVSFPPANPDDEPQWAVVRIGNFPSQTYTVLAAYPGRDDYYPYDYYRHGYYNPAFAGFSRWGYYDPFDYNYGGYSQPVPPRRHDRDRHDHAGKPHQPDGKPDHPPGTRTRWDSTPRPHPDQPRTNAYPPRTANPERWARERADRSERNNSTHRSSGGGGYSRSESWSSPSSSYTPPPASNPPPSRSESATAAREDNRSLTPQSEH